MKTLVKTLLAAACIATAGGALAAAHVKAGDMKPMTMQECKDHMAMAKKDTMAKKDDMMMKKDTMCADMMKKDDAMMKKDTMKK